MGIAARDARAHVAREGPQERDASGDVPDIDLEDAGHGVGDGDPGQIGRLDLPGGGGAGDGDGPRDEAEAHEAAEGELGAGRDVQVPEEEDGESGAEEVGQEGYGALGDEDVHDGLRREARSGLALVPDFGDGVALEDDEEEEGEVGGYEEGDQGVEEAFQFVELGEAEEEEADGYLARGERDEELGGVEVGVFEEVAVLFY